MEWPNGSKTNETLVTQFINSDEHLQTVTDGPDAECPSCGYPERHRITRLEPYTWTIADGCPSCETSRLKGTGRTDG